MASGDIGQAELIRLRRQEAEEDLATQAQLLEERSVALRQTELRAPTDGTVRELVFTTIGAAVRNGDVVLEMSPIGSELIVEAKYAPSDVAALSPGMPARVKLDAFDDSICGAVDATISDISPDALNEPDGRRREQAVARVRLQLAELPAAS